MRREISPNYAAPSTFYTQEPVNYAAPSTFYTQEPVEFFDSVAGTP